MEWLHHHGFAIIINQYSAVIVIVIVIVNINININIGIKTYTLPPLTITRLQSIRKAAVAVGGGAMMGTGAVLMATPLHPVGHAITIGGLAVLGTEFEAPKKAMESVTRKLRNSVQQKRKSSNSSNISAATATTKIIQ